MVTDQHGNTETTRTATLSIPGPEITAQPQDVAAAVGAAARTTVTATGEGLTYAWWYKDTGMSAFKKSSITAARYSMTMTEARNGRQVYCVVTDQHGNTETTRTATLSIPGPEITAQPQDVAAAVGAAARTTVTATGEGLTYAWWYKDTGMSAFKKSSITAARYSMTMTEARNGRQVYCVVTDQYGGSVTSDTVTLSIPGPEITVQPQDVAVAVGAAARTAVTAAGEGLTYAWWYKDTGMSAFKKSSITTARYSMTMTEARSGRQVYCVVTDQYGGTVTSDTATLTMTMTSSGPTITAQPQSAAAAGTAVTVKVAASGDGLTYAWWYKDTGMTAFRKGSVTTATYSVEMNETRNGRQLYCIVTDKNGSSVTSDTVTISME